jgi:hypothetical protein
MTRRRITTYAAGAALLAVLAAHPAAGQVREGGGLFSFKA